MGLLTKLSISFVKVWAAGVVGILAAAAIAAIGGPVWIVVGIGILASIAAGWILNTLDEYLGISQYAKAFGNWLGSFLPTPRARNTDNDVVVGTITDHNGNRVNITIPDSIEKTLEANKYTD